MEKIITIYDFKQLYQFKEEDFLGQGGFSKVYRATTLHGGSVALKFYDGKMGNQNDLRDEFAKIKHLHHPNLIDYKRFEVLESVGITGQKENVQVAVLEYADAGSLADLFPKHPSANTLDPLLREVFLGLAFLHDKANIVHRDITPSNILLCKSEKGLQAKISDFGIARMITASKNRKATEVIGNSTYLAPEVFLSDRYDFKVDIWAMGIIIYEAFLKRTPYEISGQQSTRAVTISKIASGIVPGIEDLAKIPSPWNTIAKRCLIKDPQLRASASECITMFQHSPSITLSNKRPEVIPGATEVFPPSLKSTTDKKTERIDKSEINQILGNKTEVILPKDLPKEPPPPPLPPPFPEEEDSPVEVKGKSILRSNKKLLISLLVVAGIMLIGFGGYTLIQNLNYNQQFEKGEERFLAADYEQALVHFEKAAELYPDRWEVVNKVEVTQDKAARVKLYDGLLEEGNQLEAEESESQAIKTYEFARSLLPNEDRGTQAGKYASALRDQLPSSSRFQLGIYGGDIEKETITGVCPHPDGDYMLVGYCTKEEDNLQCLFGKVNRKKKSKDYLYHIPLEGRDKLYATTYIRDQGLVSVGYYGIEKGHTQGVIMEWNEETKKYKDLFTYDSPYQGWVEFKNLIYDPVHEQIITVGYAQKGKGAHNGLVIKTSKTGSKQWVKQFSSELSGNSVILYGVQLFAQGYVVCGYEEGANSKRYPMVIALDWEGSVLWKQTLDMEGQANEIARTKDGGFVIVGQNFISKNQERAFLTKLRPSGDEEWTKIYRGSYRSAGLEVLEDLDGNYVMAGWRAYGKTAEPEAFLYKVNPNKKEVLATSFPSYFAQSSIAQAICLAEDGGYVVGGYINWSDDYRSAKIWKTDRNGKTNE